jgi:hypothetical protein
MFLYLSHGEPISNQWIETTTLQFMLEENCDKKTQRRKGKHG